METVETNSELMPSMKAAIQLTGPQEKLLRHIARGPVSVPDSFLVAERLSKLGFIGVEEGFLIIKDAGTTWIDENTSK